jgi:signal peptidase II
MLPLLIGIAITLVDQLTKMLILREFHLYQAVPVIPGLFDLRYIQNTGAAWGMFAGGQGWLAVLSVVVLVLLVACNRSFFSSRRCDQVAYGLIVGGIVGNFIDRVRLEYVVDFLDFYWGNHHFPAFNVADSAICCGVILYLASQAIESRRQRRDTSASGAVEGTVDDA